MNSFMYLAKVLSGSSWSDMVSRSALKVLGVIYQRAHDGDRPPTLREISRELGWSNQTGYSLVVVRQLIAKGLVTMNGNRTLRPTFHFFTPEQLERSVSSDRERTEPPPSRCAAEP